MGIKFIVEGNLPRKSNSRQVFRNKGTGKMIFAKSDKALSYEQSFYAQTYQVPKNTFPEKTPLILTATIHYQSNRSDLSDEILADLMEKTKIIPNDRYIFEKHIYKRIDPVLPRVEVTIDLLKEQAR